MTYLLTGATGFLGSRLIDMLLENGHSVQYLGRKRKRELDSRAAFYLWENPSAAAAPLDSVPRLDAIVHLAGEPIAQRWTNEVKRRIRESRVASTRNLVDAMAQLQHRPRVLVSASAVGYYGDRGDTVLTEENGPGEGFLAELCTAWEAEADRASALGMRVVKVRIGVVLGPDGGALAKMLPSFRLGLGGTLGDGTQWMPWIHRDDLLRMMMWAAETDSVRGVLNGTAPEPVTNQYFTKALAAALQRPAVFRVPRLGLRLAMGEMADFLFHSARALPAGAQRLGFMFQYPELNGCLRSILVTAN